VIRYYQQKFEIELSVPVQYKHLPPDIVLSDSVTEKIVFRIQDKGTVLLNYLFRKNRDVITFDFEGVSLDKNPYIVQKEVISDKIHAKLSTMTQLISFYPENIPINYSPLKKKELPVVLSEKIYPAVGYIFVDTICIQPSSVIVYGSSQTLDKLREINIAPLKKNIFEKKIDILQDLQIPPGVRLSVEKVRLTAILEAYTEKTFELPVIVRNLPENLYIRFFPSSVELVCQVALNKYSQLSEVDMEVSIDYNQLKQNENMTIPLLLGKKPKELINYRIIPERVEYLIEKKDRL
jgi:hypothetical protein